MVDTPVSEDSRQVPADSTAESTESQTAPKQQRVRSSVRFPYSDLQDVVQVVEAMYHQYGGRCTSDQLAAALKQTTTSGAFRIKTSTAQMVGAIDIHRGTLILTELGRRLADQETRAGALVEAFLNVELYQRIFNKYQGGRLPRDTGLEADMVAEGVAPKQASRARQAFQRSAEVAGFFWQGRDRLVLPPSAQAGTLAGVSTTTTGSVAQEPAHQEPDILLGRHPLIVGLFKELPTEDTDFPAEKRKVWLTTAAAIFSLVWGEAEVEAEAQPKAGASESKTRASEDGLSAAS